MESETGTVWEAPNYDSVDESLGDPYCFESDHVALQSNPDYHRLLRTICVLEAQRAKAISDMELLYQAQEQVLEDPISFVDRLQRTGNLGIQLPGRQKIAELPEINWKKYTSSVDFRSFGTNRQSARLKQHGNETAEDEHLQRLKSNLEGDTYAGEGTVAEGYVRGRFKDESKSSTFNKLWTPDEQKRLDELLIKFPPEEVEARRWRKIAAAFGDRTPQQIASRVQKYFQKLERNKLPVPGRVPNRVGPRIKKATHRHQRHNWLYRESTFLQRYKPPVMMKEDGEDTMMGIGEVVPSVPHGEQSVADPTGDGVVGEEGAGVGAGGGKDLSDEEDFPDELRLTAEYKELQQLKNLRDERLQMDPSLPLHQGFKCDRCGCAPIVGLRWHCVDCPSTTSLDFCNTCFNSLDAFDTAPHNSSHRMRPVKRTWNKSAPDQDYLNFSNKDTSSNYNYLDPNYMPAV
ncbi:ZZ-type zinc finger-containing protein 3-like [Babylonia areolata]|uniref:ZZ-type zinc finger-containing protein 3-like n=1 Tax=Babylonia areolata TaxID=304850 RepID=UPI003FD559EE